MNNDDLSAEFRARLDAVRNRRARVVIDHIIEHGHITTEELAGQYGYDHPPRAARDVREAGIALQTFRVKSSQGRSIGAYRFADPSDVRENRVGGRRSFPLAFKKALLQQYGTRCMICGDVYEPRYLQIDHRIPYQVMPDSTTVSLVTEDYMLVCGSCNRAKSWSCEHCLNWLEEKKPGVCQTCYWFDPNSYAHIALRAIRRMQVVWNEDEVKSFDALVKRARRAKQQPPQYVKDVINRHLSET